MPMQKTQHGGDASVPTVTLQLNTIPSREGWELFAPAQCGGVRVELLWDSCPGPARRAWGKSGRQCARSLCCLSPAAGSTASKGPGSASPGQGSQHLPASRCPSHPQSSGVSTEHLGYLPLSFLSFSLYYSYQCNLSSIKGIPRRGQEVFS